MNPRTSKEKIIEIAKGLFVNSPEKILENTITAYFEDVNEVWTVLVEVDTEFDGSSIIIHIHDKTHEARIMPIL